MAKQMRRDYRELINLADIMPRVELSGEEIYLFVADCHTITTGEADKVRQ